MTCRDVTDFLAAYLAHDLEPDVDRTFKRHLVICANCQKFLSQYEETVRAGRAACAEEDLQIPEDLVRAIVTALKEA